MLKLIMFILLQSMENVRDMKKLIVQLDHKLIKE
jgi:hypothetical protein